MFAKNAGGAKEIQHASQLAARVHNGEHIDTTEEGNGRASQSETSPASRRHFLLGQWSLSGRALRLCDERVVFS